jgi:hypothetical protein
MGPALALGDLLYTLEEYFAVTAKVEALYSQPAELPADNGGHHMRRPRAEMHRRMLGDGYCARPLEMDCHFESIWSTAPATSSTSSAPKPGAAASTSTSWSTSSTSWSTCGRPPGASATTPGAVGRQAPVRAATQEVWPR